MKADNRIKIETAEVGSKVLIMPTGVQWQVLAHEGGYTQVKSKGTTKWIKDGKRVFTVINE